MPCNVLIIGNFLSESIGTRSVCEDLASRLAGIGLKVLTSSSRPGRVSRLVDMLATVVSCRALYSVALVDVYSGPAFLWAEAVCLALRSMNKPYVLTLHGGNLPQFATRWPSRVRRLLHSAASVTTPSRYLLEQMQPYCNDLCMIPNALDLSRYTYQLRKSPSPKLVWLRAFHHIYNPVMVIDVLAKLVAALPGVHLTMVGPDKGDCSLQQTQERAKQLGVVGRVTFTGAVPKTEVPVWLQHGDIFLNTTNVDNTPISVLESMACGHCVVSTNVGGLPYLLDHEHDALLVQPQDPTAMANAVKRLLTEPNLAQRLSRNSREKAVSYDWPVVLPQWERLLSRVAAGSTL